MSVDMKISYNSGAGYKALFPKTNVKSIKYNGVIKQGVIFVTIPPTQETEQIVPVDTDTMYLSAPVYMQLLPDSDIYDYQTITQFEVVENGVKIIRLYKKPVKEVKVALYFAFNDVQVIKRTKIDITIPAYAKVGTQLIPYSFTEAQKLAPFYVELKTNTEEAKNEYFKISQFEVFGDYLKVTRLNEGQSGVIEVALVFEESGE